MTEILCGSDLELLYRIIEPCHVGWAKYTFFIFPPNEGSWKVMFLCEILFQINKNISGDISHVATDLWGGLFEV